MKLKDILLMVLLAAVWGFNFVPIRIGLNHVPIFTLTCMRFLLTFFPALFFVKRPAVPIWKLALYGAFLFAGQFGFVFSGIHAGLSPGLASVVMQFQVFVTIILAAFFLHEKPAAFQIIGALISFSGIAFVGMHVGGDVSLLGLTLVIIATFCWSGGNILTKTFGKIDMFAAIIWGNFFAFLIMSIPALIFEGPTAIRDSILHLDGTTALSVAYIAYVSTFVGYTIWSFMLSHYPAASVVPFTLLVPIFAMASATFFLGESFTFWKFEAACLVMSGLAFNQFGAKLFARMAGIFARKAPDEA